MTSRAVRGVPSVPSLPTPAPGGCHQRRDIAMRRTTGLSRRALGGVLSVGLLLAVVGCGDDDSSSSPTTAGEDPTTEASAPDETEAPPDGGGASVEITGVDYAFEGVPDSVTAGTELSFLNGSEGEVHEIVALLLPDDEERPVDELVTLPEEEIDAIFGTGPPALVTVAGPGEAGEVAVGDGTLAEAGRYVLICAIPTGADPEEFFDPANQSEEGPPDVEGGPPHFVQGMYAELRVEA